MHCGRISHQDFVYSYVREANGKAGLVVRNVHDSSAEIDPGIHVFDLGRDLGGANPDDKNVCVFAKISTVRGYSCLHAFWGLGRGSIALFGDPLGDVVVI